MTESMRGKTKWRDYLDGKYVVTDRRLRNELRHDIRRRAIKMMEDLLLILEKSDARQLTLIRYHWLEKGKRKSKKKQMLILRLQRQIQNKLVYPSKTLDKEIKGLREDLDVLGIRHKRFRYDIIKLVNDRTYRDKKRKQVDSFKHR
jgi:ABC-type phosphate transport system auxiliary subunit